VATLARIPIITIGAFVAVVIAAIVMFGTRTGRDLYAIGSDPDAARVFGIPVDRRVVGAFLASGPWPDSRRAVRVSVQLGWRRYGNGLRTADRGGGRVGGVAIFGGSGTVAGAAIGAVLLTTMTGALASLNVSKFWQQAIVGVLIIAAILIDRILSLRTARRLRVSEARNV